MAAAKNPLCRPAKDDELSNPLAVVDAANWLGGSIAGQKVLCLAAGGGRQSSLYAAAGADVTVVDLSSAMLELDRQVAHERGYRVRLIETSMEDLSGLQDGEFDLVVQPVSTCYVPNIQPVFAEVARVLRGGGIYVSQHKQPGSLQASMNRTDQGYALRHTYYRDTPVPDADATTKSSRRLRETGAVEFLHRWEELIGGMCRAGFMVADLVEPMHAKKNAERGSFADRAAFVAPYVRIKAIRRRTTESVASGPAKIWIPEES